MDEYRAVDAAALARLKEEVQAGRTRLFHGGAPGRRVSDFLRPPTVTGSLSLRDHPQQQGLGTVTTRPDRVYVTTERSLAAASAAYWRKRSPGNSRGWLYRVEVDENELVPDEDLPRGPFISFQVPQARVAAVLDRGVDASDPRHARELLRFLRAMG